MTTYVLRDGKLMPKGERERPRGPEIVPDLRSPFVSHS